MTTTHIPPQPTVRIIDRIEPINWNRLDDEKDLEVWNRLTANFWLPEKVALSNDLPNWREMDPKEKQVVMHVFTGLTLLDTVQASLGEVCQIQDSSTPHEEAVYTNIAFMQSVHARSYSSVFSTLASTQEIDQAYAWAVNTDVLQRRATAVMEYYVGTDPLKRKVAAVLLSSFLLYAGFYLPLHLSCRGKLTNTADMVRLILRDKAVHGYYSGYKYQRGLERLDASGREQMREFTMGLLQELYELELEYSSLVFDELGMTDAVHTFVRYNANKALMNLGYNALFNAEETQVSPDILAALSPGSNENHDFFSGSGSAYVIGRAVETDDGDWAF